MTQYRPYLAIRRLTITHRGTNVYDQLFHNGVNIIRGVNSTGKSTISDFIFFIIGGDFTQWKPEAERCDTVIAEVEINGDLVTLRRHVSKDRHQPMEIYWGDFEKASTSITEGWQRFAYARSGTKESFSQVLFRTLGFPEVSGDKESNITMHQILRLISVDQLSRVHSLMRDEPFDSPLTRRTVGDVLMGIYDDHLYSNQLKLREAKASLSAAEAQNSSLVHALAGTSMPPDVETLIKRQEEIENSVNGVEAALAEIIKSQTELPEEDGRLLRDGSIKLGERQREYAALLRKVDQLKLNIADSDAFLANIRSRMVALDESVITENTLGQMLLQMCPECLQPVSTKKIEGHCGLCRETVEAGGRTERLARMKHELSSQLFESERCQEQRRKDLGKGEAELQVVNLEMMSLQRDLNFQTNTVRSARDSQLDGLFQKKGSLVQELQLILFQKQLVQKMMDSAAQIKLMKGRIFDLEGKIKTGLGTQEERRFDANLVVERIAKFFLHKDLAREAAFEVANEVTVDFERNICEVDGRVNFSASSITYLRASVNFALFFASLELSFFRYPRFIINDNIEDKGMEEKRSQNFQKLIVQLSKDSAVQHQIILTTSMIAPELDTDELCIGPKYTPSHKTLDFSATDGAV